MRDKNQDLFLKGFDGGDYAWNPEDDERQTKRQNQISPYMYSQPKYTPTSYESTKLQSIDSPQTLENQLSNYNSSTRQPKNAQIGIQKDLASNALESFEKGYYPSDSDLNTLGVNYNTAHNIMEGLMNRSMTRDDAYQLLNNSGVSNSSGYTSTASASVNTAPIQKQRSSYTMGVRYSPITGNIQSYTPKSIASLRESDLQIQSGTTSTNFSFNRMSEPTNSPPQGNLIGNAVESFMNGYYPTNEDLDALGITMDNARNLMRDVMNRNISRENLYDIFTRTANLIKPLSASTQQNVPTISNLSFQVSENERPTVELYRHVPGTDAAGSGTSGAGPLSTSGVQNMIRGLANGTRTVDSLTPGESQQIMYNLTHGIPNIDQNMIQRAKESVQNWITNTVTRVKNDDVGLKMRAALYNASGKTYNGQKWPALEKYKKYYDVMTPEERSKALENINDSVKLGEYVNSLHLDDRIEKKEFDPALFILGLPLRASAYSGYAVFSTVHALEDAASIFLPGYSDNSLGGYLRDYFKNYLDETEQMYAENAAAGGPIAQMINQYGPATIVAIPLIMMTYGGAIPGLAGGSLEAEAVLEQGGSSLINSARIMFEKFKNDPKFWYSIFYSYGTHYDHAIEGGAEKAQATAYAIFNSVFGAIIDSSENNDAKGNSNKFSVEDMLNAGLRNSAKSVFSIANEYNFYRSGDVFDVYDLKAIWGSFLEGAIEEGLTQSIKVVGSTIWKAIDLTDMYDLTNNGYSIDWEDFKQKYASNLSKLSEAQQEEAFDFYLADMTTVKYNGEQMNFVRFLNEKLMENSGSIDLVTVENAFTNLFEVQYRRRTQPRR